MLTYSHTFSLYLQMAWQTVRTRTVASASAVKTVTIATHHRTPWRSSYVNSPRAPRRRSMTVCVFLWRIRVCRIMPLWAPSTTGQRKSPPSPSRFLEIFYFDIFLLRWLCFTLVPVITFGVIIVLILLHLHWSKLFWLKKKIKYFK